MAVNYLCFDYGKRSIGVAVGQALTKDAQAVGCVAATKGVPDWKAIDALVKTWDPKAFVLGYPLNMDGSEQSLGRALKVFANNLHARYQLPYYWCDERLTTYEAKRAYRHSRRQPAKAVLDAQSAQVILHHWLQQNDAIE